MNAAEIIQVFDSCFVRSHATHLVGGGTEPLYLPSTESDLAQLIFRDDYASSALHEAAHWCLANNGRRRQTDFGYRYIQPPRSFAEQRQFYRLELRSQSLEWHFSQAAGVAFSISSDNVVDGAVHDRKLLRLEDAFLRQLHDQHKLTQAWLCTRGGNRATAFISALSRANG
jgi:elongation factor P hydroxylase